MCKQLVMLMVWIWHDKRPIPSAHGVYFEHVLFVLEDRFHTKSQSGLPTCVLSYVQHTCFAVRMTLCVCVFVCACMHIVRLSRSYCHVTVCVSLKGLLCLFNCSMQFKKLEVCISIVILIRVVLDRGDEETRIGMEGICITHSCIPPL